MATVTVYSKPGCHLCDVVHDALMRVQADQPFELAVVNIEDDPDLMAQYGHQIPVVLLDGKFAFRYKIDEARLRELLRR
jgi:glutaredoxin